MKGQITLSSFIKKNKEQIAEEWVIYARENIGVTIKMDLATVRDHIIEMLDGIAEDIGTPQTESEQDLKSKGHKQPRHIDDMAAKEHGEQRVEAGFDIVELSSEFRALRASVLRLWEKNMTGPIEKETFEDMIRFNEAIDEAWMHSMKRFHTKVDESKNWFIGILGHDLRNPLSAISGTQQILARSSNLSKEERALVKRSESSVKRMEELINNMLELTRLRLGSGMTIKKTQIDLTLQSEQIIQEFMTAYPEAKLHFQSHGPLLGKWDGIRINQVLTNLLANALRHGQPGGPVSLNIKAKKDNAIISVHNEGRPIPESMQEKIFTGMFTEDSENRNNQTSYGLGLYIVKEIVNSHNGTIEVTSNEKDGTTFTITMPRH